MKKLIITCIAVLLVPLSLSAKGNGPTIGSVSYPSNITANIAATLSASVSSAVGATSCNLYIDAQDIGAMNLSPSSASLSYTFSHGGVYTVFVFCRDIAGGMSSGPNTSIFVGGATVDQPAYSGNTSSNAPPQTDTTTQSANTTSTSSITIPTGSLIKLNCPEGAALDNPCKTVYYYGKDLKRHAFPNEHVYFTWYTNFDSVTSTDETTMGQISLGRNVTYRPGIRMVKFQTLDRVYTVSKGGVLRWVTSEDIALILYGSNWNKQIDDISDAFYNNYTFESDLVGISDYSKDEQMSITPTIDDSMKS
jgi:hypothetical protein